MEFSGENLDSAAQVLLSVDECAQPVTVTADCGLCDHGQLLWPTFALGVNFAAR